MKRIYSLAPLAVLLALLLAACSGGDGTGGADGGSGESRDPSEEEIQAAEDALSDEERKVGDAVQQAIADLDARIPAIDPCKPDPAQLEALYGPLGVLQASGDLGDAYEGPIADALGPVVRSIARAYARGDLGGSGITSQDIVDWARGTGVDPLADDWMIDERCTERWRIEAEWNGTLAAATALEARSVGHVDFTVYQGGPIVESGPIEMTLEMELPNDACSIDWVIASEPLDVEGVWDFAPNAFIVDATFGGYAATGTITCPGVGALPPFTHSSGPSTLPVTLDAADGFTHRVGGELMPGVSSEFTFTVHRLD
ncbi:MAG: hypothetical protein AB7F65_07975 [Dehalococcoidia bacterium]